MYLLRTYRIQMRKMTAALAAACVLIGSTALAQTLRVGVKPFPSTQDITDMFGQPLAKVFEKFGPPNDVHVDNPKAKTPGVYIDYNKYSFVVVDKVVTQCEVGSDWPTPIFGVTMGDDSDAIVKAMGKPNLDIKNANGTEMMVWNRSDNKSKISITFDKEHKSDGLFLELK